MERMLWRLPLQDRLSAILPDNNIIRLFRIFSPYGARILKLVADINHCLQNWATIRGYQAVTDFFRYQLLRVLRIRPGDDRLDILPIDRLFLWSTYLSTNCLSLLLTWIPGPAMESIVNIISSENCLNHFSSSYAFEYDFPSGVFLHTIPLFRTVFKRWNNQI